jgi:hypothetical protein
MSVPIGAHSRISLTFCGSMTLCVGASDDRSLPLSTDEVTIGRHNECAVVLTNSDVSRMCV